MPDITVRFYTTLRKAAETDEFACSAATVREALDCVKKRFGPEFMKRVRRCQVFVNSDNVIHMHGHRTRLNRGDFVHIFPPAAGG
jgi:molybdopterin converting factor small subunit